MKRREFVTLLGASAAAWPLAARAQQRPMPVIGVLYGVSEAEWSVQMAGFRRGLGEMGFVEGRNVAIEYRWADGQYDRMPTMAADLVRRKVAIILVGGSTTGVRATMAATQSIPIVFTTTNDPVDTGLVASLNRPGGNVTGLTSITGELVPKQLELLHEAVPMASKIALLVNPNGMATLQDTIQRAKTAATRLGLELIVVNGSTQNEIESAFLTAIQQQSSALQVAPEAFLISQRELIATLALRHGLPAIGPTRETVTAGMLMSYSASAADTYRQAGIYVGRILKGEKPSDLPVMQPTRFQFVLNLKTAKTLGLDIPLKLHAFADEVIE